jgi:hypothetical protein
MADTAEYEVYVPVVVSLNEKLLPVWANIDFDGAPWMFVDKESNVFFDGDWTTDPKAEEAAITGLQEILANAFQTTEGT